MDEINSMFEAVHTSKWLPQVERHTFPSKLEELTAAEEQAFLDTTTHKRGGGGSARRRSGMGGGTVSGGCEEVGSRARSVGQLPTPP